MKIVSNNLLKRMKFSDDTIIRINLAWIKDKQEAKNIIRESKHRIYLDYPQGRTKPPTPKIGFKEALCLAQEPNVHYFAVSNVEEADKLLEIKNLLPRDVLLVPKIETSSGVSNLEKIIDVGIGAVMLDKEDLYINLNMNNSALELCIDNVREITKLKEVPLLELSGVVFYEV